MGDKKRCREMCETRHCRGNLCAREYWICVAECGDYDQLILYLFGV